MFVSIHTFEDPELTSPGKRPYLYHCSTYMMEYAAYKTFAIITGRHQFCKKISVFVVSIHIGRSPFFSIITLSNQVVCNTLVLIPQHRVCNCGISQYWLAVYLGTCVALVLDDTHPNFVVSVQHCFVTKNMEPKIIDSTLVCLFYDQYTGAHFRYTRNNVLELLVTLLSEWSMLDFTLMVNPST